MIPSPRTFQQFRTFQIDDEFAVISVTNRRVRNL